MASLEMETALAVFQKAMAEAAPQAAPGAVEKVGCEEFEAFFACPSCGEEAEYHVGALGEYEPCGPSEALGMELIK